LRMGPGECFESFARWEKSDTYSALRAAEATTARVQFAGPLVMFSVEYVKCPGESALWDQVGDQQRLRRFLLAVALFPDVVGA